MNDDQLCEVWLGATRYYLGRMTASVSSFCETLMQQWNQLPSGCRRLIQRDVEEAFARDDAQRGVHQGYSGIFALGHDCDRAAWEQVRTLWQKELVP